MINDRIDQWHTSPDVPGALHEYLGWTWREYAAWVERGTAPPNPIRWQA
jgi:hypothetical protein